MDKLKRYYEICGRGDPEAPTMSVNDGSQLPETVSINGNSQLPETNDQMLQQIDDNGSNCSIVPTTMETV